MPVSARARPNVNRPIFVSSPANKARLFAPTGRVISAPVTGISKGVLVTVTTGAGRVTIGVLVKVATKPPWGVNVVVAVTVLVTVGVKVTLGITPGRGVRVDVGVAVKVWVATRGVCVTVLVTVGVNVKLGIIPPAGVSVVVGVTVKV